MVVGWAGNGSSATLLTRSMRGVASEFGGRGSGSTGGPARLSPARPDAFLDPTAGKVFWDSRLSVLLRKFLHLPNRMGPPLGAGPTVREEGRRKEGALGCYKRRHSTRQPGNAARRPPSNKPRKERTTQPSSLLSSCTYMYNNTTMGPWLGGLAGERWVAMTGPIAATGVANLPRTCHPPKETVVRALGRRSPLRGFHPPFCGPLLQ